jgi:hypothetical protein
MKTNITDIPPLGVNSTRTQSVLLLDPASYASAQKTCSNLGESLWTPQIDDFLPYLAYKNSNASALYWARGGCVNITTRGYESAKTACGEEEQHGAICTNSAPRSESTKVNNASHWGIDVAVEGSFITG